MTALPFDLDLRDDNTDPLLHWQTIINNEFFVPPRVDTPPSSSGSDEDSDSGSDDPEIVPFDLTDYGQPGVPPDRLIPIAAEILAEAQIQIEAQTLIIMRSEEHTSEL